MKRHFCGAVALMLLTGSSLAGAEPKNFSSPEEAGKSVVAACKSDNVKELMQIFGPEAKGLVRSVDPQQDRQSRRELAAAAAKHSGFETRGKARIWVLGSDLWPFPIPLVESKGLWHFDTEAGYAEVMKRRVGRDELAVIELLGALTEAQKEYASLDRHGDGVKEYAQKILSTPGRHDGLYWAPDKAGPSPMEGFVASVRDYCKGKPANSTWMGYRVKFLTGQGPHVPGGQYSYIVNGHMLLGYAVLAYPADYGRSGIMTFMMNQHGKVLEKDLGPNTVKLAEPMKLYDPDKSWTPVPPSGMHVPPAKK